VVKWVINPLNDLDGLSILNYRVSRARRYRAMVDIPQESFRDTAQVGLNLWGFLITHCAILSHRSPYRLLCS
jgi:hypothetical protein